MGLISVARDLGLQWSLVVQTDASAAIGVCRRRGLGKTRRLATADLWIQENLRNNEFELVKIPGQQNAADALTKHLDRATLERHVHAMGLRQAYGRAQSAPTLDPTACFLIPVAAISRLANR